MRKILNEILDNRFWYIGFTSAGFGYDEENIVKAEYDKCPCVIIANPFRKTWPRKS